MLVLSRKTGERIIIADGLITLVVRDVKGDRVVLGVEAPIDIPIHRGEVHDRIQAREKGAA